MKLINLLDIEIKEDMHPFVCKVINLILKIKNNKY